MDLARDPAIRVVGINHKDNPENARRFLGALGNPFAAVGVDPNGRAAIDWGVYGVPETFIVGPDGTIRHKQIGPLSPQNISTFKAAPAPSLELNRPSAARRLGRFPPGRRRKPDHATWHRLRPCAIVPPELAMPLPAKSRHVVIGAGIHGLSTAYHLGEAARQAKEAARPISSCSTRARSARARPASPCGVVRNNYFQPAMRALMAHRRGRESDPEAY